MVAGVLLAMVGFVVTYATVASAADRCTPWCRSSPCPHVPSFVSLLSLSVLFVVVRRSGGRGGGGLALVIKSSTVVRSYEERAVLIARVKHYAPRPFTHPFNRLLVASLSLPLPYRLISAPPLRRLQANRGRMVTISLHGYIFFGR